MKRMVITLTIWILALFLAIFLSVFLHEVGHGLGARLEGIHVSTGFNQVGDYGKAPGDPDFRSIASAGSVLGGLLGPMFTWGLAILFTLWLYHFKDPSRQALLVGALAVTNGLGRFLPLVTALISNLMGLPRLEDEVGWGIWAVAKYCKPASLPPGMDYHTLLGQYPQVFFSELIFWLPMLISLAVSLACLISAYRQIVHLWGKTLSPVAMWLFGLMPPTVHYMFMPLQGLLDRLIRINW